MAAQQRLEIFGLLVLREVEGLALVDVHACGFQGFGGTDRGRQVQGQQAQQRQAAHVQLVLGFLDPQLLGGDVGLGLHDFELGHAPGIDQGLIHVQ